MPPAGGKARWASTAWGKATKRRRGIPLKQTAQLKSCSRYETAQLKGFNWAKLWQDVTPLWIHGVDDPGKPALSNQPLALLNEVFETTLLFSSLLLPVPYSNHMRSGSYKMKLRHQMHQSKGLGTFSCTRFTCHKHGMLTTNGWGNQGKGRTASVPSFLSFLKSWTSSPTLMKGRG